MTRTKKSCSFQVLLWVQKSNSNTFANRKTKWHSCFGTQFDSFFFLIQSTLNRMIQQFHPQLFTQDK